MLFDECRAEWFYQFWISISPPCLPSSFGLIRLTIPQQRLFESFEVGRHGDHLGYRKWIILAVLNLHVALMPSIKFQLKLTYSFGGDVVWRISRWLLWGPAILDVGKSWFYQFWISMSPPCLPPSFGSIRLGVWEQNVVWRFSSCSKMDIAMDQF